MCALCSALYREQGAISDSAHLLTVYEIEANKAHRSEFSMHCSCKLIIASFCSLLALLFFRQNTSLGIALFLVVVQEASK